MGTMGAQGGAGPDGQWGYKGVQGSKGIQGAKGTQGVQGTKGTQGVQGTKGPQGNAGTLDTSNFMTLNTSQSTSDGISKTFNGSYIVFQQSTTSGQLGININNPNGLGSGNDKSYIFMDPGTKSEGLVLRQKFGYTTDADVLTLKGPVNSVLKSVTLSVKNGDSTVDTLGVEGHLEVSGYIHTGRLYLDSSLDSTPSIQGSIAQAYLGDVIMSTAWTRSPIANETSVWNAIDTLAQNVGGGGVTMNGTSRTSKTYLMGSSSTSGTISTVYHNTNIYWESNNLYASSDIRLKHDIRKIDENLIKCIYESNDPLIYDFNWNDNDSTSTGFIAQYLEEIIPDVVTTDDNGFKAVNYNGALSKLVEILIEKTREQDKRINILENIINKLKAVFIDTEN